MKSFRHPLVAYGSFVALCAIVVLGNMLASPSEPGNAVLLGFSLPRLALAMGLFAAALAFIAMTIRSFLNQEWAERFLEGWFGRGRFSGVTGWLGGISFGLGWSGLFLPSQRLGQFESYWVRVQPVMVFLLLAGIATLVLWYIRHKRSSFIDHSNSGVIRLGMIVSTILLPVVTIMLLSGFGIRAQDDFWYGAGVPVLVPQLIGAILGGILFLQAERKWKFKRLDLFVVILIFAVTAILWSREPLQKGFSFVSYPPNNILYPIFDPAVFDTASQFPLIGERIQIFGGYFFERPLYLVLLVYLHSFLGQDYEVLMAWQAGLFAVFPVLIYLIGRSLNHRAVGFTAALVTMLRGINSIAASNMIDLANPKMILTDFPAAIGVALIVLAVCEWLKQPAGKWRYALWVGGALGFTLMLRTNALMLLALIPLYALFKFSRDWKNWLFHTSLLVLAIIAITVPWELRNRSLGGQMYAPIIAKFRAVIDTRYILPSDTGAAPQLPTTQTLFVLSQLYQREGRVQSSENCDSIACFVPNHFLHNIVMSVLTLPTSPVMDGLRETVRDNYPYWYPRWDGRFAPASLVFFILNILVIMLGIVIAWDRTRLPGLAPLAIFLFYNLSNAFARTSGGRYVVPIDWVVTLYFLLGVMQLIVWLARTVDAQWETTDEEAFRFRPVSAELPKAVFTIAALLSFGSILPLSEHLHDVRFQNFDIQQTLIENKLSLETAGLDLPSIESFLQNETADVLIGRALFPRHYWINEGHTYFYPNLPLPFPRLTFNLIGPGGQQAVILPGDIPAHFPHAGDVIVIGCREKDYVDALAVIVLDGQGAVYTRLPEAELTCPMPQPVCDKNSVCQ